MLQQMCSDVKNMAMQTIKKKLKILLSLFHQLGVESVTLWRHVERIDWVWFALWGAPKKEGLLRIKN